MRLLIVFLLGFVWWPFHHKPQPVPHPLIAPIIVHFPDSACDQDNGTFFFAGPDGLLGFSNDSCFGAYQDWLHNPLDGIKTYKL